MSLFSMPEQMMPVVKAQSEMFDGLRMFMFSFQYPPQTTDEAKSVFGNPLAGLDSPLKFAVAGNAIAAASAGHAFGLWVGWLEAARGAIAAGGADRTGDVPGRAPVTLTVVPRAEPVAVALADPEAGPAQDAANAKTISIAGPKVSAGMVTRIDPAGEAAARPPGLEQARVGGADDLKLISGIGPKLETVLNDLGIYHFDQIAGWSQRQIRWMDDYLRFRGRIDRDNWIGQAEALAAGGRGEYRKRFGKDPG